MKVWGKILEEISNPHGSLIIFLPPAVGVKNKIHALGNKLEVRSTKTEKYSGRMPEILSLKGKMTRNIMLSSSYYKEILHIGSELARGTVRLLLLYRSFS